MSSAPRFLAPHAAVAFRSSANVYGVVIGLLVVGLGLISPGVVAG